MYAEFLELKLVTRAGEKVRLHIGTTSFSEGSNFYFNGLDIL
jgi:hypothetical protein